MYLILFLSTTSLLRSINIPLYLIRPQQILSSEAGSHRFLWDMHFTPLNEPASYPMTAIYQNTAPAATSPWVLPGNYIVKLTVNGKTVSQPFTIKMDPRVKTSLADLQKQFTLSMICYEGRIKAKAIGAKSLESKFASLLDQIQETEMIPTTQLTLAVKQVSEQLEQLIKK